MLNLPVAQGGSMDLWLPLDMTNRVSPSTSYCMIWKKFGYNDISISHVSIWLQIIIAKIYIHLMYKTTNTLYIQTHMYRKYMIYDIERHFPIMQSECPRIPAFSMLSFPWPKYTTHQHRCPLDTLRRHLSQPFILPWRSFTWNSHLQNYLEIAMRKGWWKLWMKSHKIGSYDTIY